MNQNPTFHKRVVLDHHMNLNEHLNSIKKRYLG